MKLDKDFTTIPDGTCIWLVMVFSLSQFAPTMIYGHAFYFQSSGPDMSKRSKSYETILLSALNQTHNLYYMPKCNQ